MATSPIFILFSILVSFVASTYSTPIGSKSTGIILPVSKTSTTLQYYATLQTGNTLADQNLFLDLGGEFLWFNCDNYTSSSYRPIRCGSRKCENAKGPPICAFCNGTPKPGCTNNTCAVDQTNPYANMVSASKGLGEDNIKVKSTNGVKISDHVLPHFEISCAHTFLLEGLASGITGSLGLAKTNISFHKQISSAFKLAHKFSICLPSGTNNRSGSRVIGGTSSYMLSNKKDMSRSLLTTPLITNPVTTGPFDKEGQASYEYFIKVNSIKVGGKILSLNMALLEFDKNGVGGTKVSTTASYTILETSIYKAIKKEFVKKAGSMKIVRVASVKPFGACFSSKTISNTKTGPNVPIIDLVLQNKDVYWRINGLNSMVKVKKGVVCLALVDGGLQPRTTIVLGAHQLEENLVQFDLDSSKLQFSNLLLLQNTTCSYNPLV